MRNQYKHNILKHNTEGLLYTYSLNSEVCNDAETLTLLFIFMKFIENDTLNC